MKKLAALAAVLCMCLVPATAQAEGPVLTAVKGVHYTELSWTNVPSGSTKWEVEEYEEWKGAPSQYYWTNIAKRELETPEYNASSETGPITLKYRVRATKPVVGEWSNQAVIFYPWEESAATVSKEPNLPAALKPAAGWHAAYADAFGAAIGAGGDETWAKSENNLGCCGNENEIASERPSQVTTSAAKGLDLKCERKEVVAGKAYNCGGVSGSGAAKDPLVKFAGETLAVEWKGKLPPNMGMADPGVWEYGSASSEFDWPELWGWGSAGPGWAKQCGGWVWHYTGNTGWDKCKWNSEWAPNEPENGEHTYTTYIHPTSGGKYRFSVYIDGVLTKLGNEATGCYSLSCALEESGEYTPTASTYSNLVVTYALRKAESAEGKTNEAAGTGFPNVFNIRSYALYIDAGSAGKGDVTNEGVAPGTTLK